MVHVSASLVSPQQATCNAGLANAGSRRGCANTPCPPARLVSRSVSGLKSECSPSSEHQAVCPCWGQEPVTAGAGCSPASPSPGDIAAPCVLEGGTSSRDIGLIDEGNHPAGLLQQGPQGPLSLQKSTEGNYLSILLSGKVTSGGLQPRRSQSNVAGAMGDAVQHWCSALLLALAPAWPPLSEARHPWVPATLPAAPCREELRQPHVRAQAEPSPSQPYSSSAPLQGSLHEPPLHGETQWLLSRCTPAKSVHPDGGSLYRHRSGVSQCCPQRRAPSLGPLLPPRGVPAPGRSAGHSPGQLCQPAGLAR